MPFIGNQPAESYSAFQKQDFSTSATTSYTLDHPVSNQNEIALFINFVRQEPTAAYTASGTTLTLTSATASSDDMYCVYLGKAVQTVNPPSGSVGTSQLASSLDLSSKTITLASDMKNTPAFLADNGTTRQTLADDTTTKIDFGTEIYDTDNAFASSKFTVPSGEAGKYFIYASVDIFNGGNDMTNFTFYLYKNGSAFTLHTFNGNGNANLRRNTLFFSYTLDLAAADYIEFYVEVEDSGSDSMDIRENNNATYFGGFKLIGV